MNLSCPYSIQYEKLTRLFSSIISSFFSFKIFMNLKNSNITKLLLFKNLSIVYNLNIVSFKIFLFFNILHKNQVE